MGEVDRSGPVQPQCIIREDYQQRFHLRRCKRLPANGHQLARILWQLSLVTPAAIGARWIFWTQSAIADALLQSASLVHRQAVTASKPCAEHYWDTLLSRGKWQRGLSGRGGSAHRRVVRRAPVRVCVSCDTASFLKAIDLSSHPDGRMHLDAVHCARTLLPHALDTVHCPRTLSLSPYALAHVGSIDGLQGMSLRQENLSTGKCLHRLANLPVVKYSCRFPAWLRISGQR